MAFDRGGVGTPRFYVDRGKYLQVKGYNQKNELAGEDGIQLSDDMRDTYEHREWDWDNLPEIEIMFEVIRRYEKKKEKDKKRDAK